VTVEPIGDPAACAWRPPDEVGDLELPAGRVMLAVRSKASPERGGRVLCALERAAEGAAPKARVIEPSRHLLDAGRPLAPGPDGSGALDPRLRLGVWARDGRALPPGYAHRLIF
jgi:hypothetical protein